MQTHDHSPWIDRTHDCGTDTVSHGDQPLGACQHPVLEDGEDRADDGEGNKSGDEHGAQRGDKQVDHLRHLLMKPFFYRAHEQYGQYDRYDMSLIANLLHVEEEQMPGRDLTRCIVRNGPCVDQSRMNHHKTNNGSQETVSAEYPCG